MCWYIYLDLFFERNICRIDYNVNGKEQCYKKQCNTHAHTHTYINIYKIFFLFFWRQLPFNDDPWHGVAPGTSPSMMEPNENEPHSHFKQNSGWPLITVPGPPPTHTPPQSYTENTYHQKKTSTRPEPFPWRSLREHMVTWLWDVRGLNVLRLLFPVKRFKLLGYDKSLWCFMLSIERRNKGDGGGGAARCGVVRCGGEHRNDSC